MILGYSPIVALKTLKEWKVVITLVGQGYESTEERQDYKMGTGTIYGGQGQPMDIGKSSNNFKDRKLKCFNCNKYWTYSQGMLEEERERNKKMF